MSEILIITKDKFEASTHGYILVGINNFDGIDINCFIPKEQPKKAGQYLCFIPFSKDNGWNYKQQARATRYSIGGDICRILDTDFSYLVHRKLNLSYNEEAHLLLLSLEFFLGEVDSVSISHKIDLGDKQNIYLQKLIDEEKVKVLYE